MIAADAKVGFGFDAVEMPLPFAELVLTELGIAMLDGPVVADRMRRLATFLTLPATTRRLPADLQAIGVRAVPAGERLLLPGRAGHIRWLAPPSRPLTVWTAVLGTARRVALHCDPVWTSQPALPTVRKAA
ncbi:MAG TPA: hypothetical protein VL652_04945 [Kutzneria sp.]|nr:hypothetical protein [Kutzneria sp.]